MAGAVQTQAAHEGLRSDREGPKYGRWISIAIVAIFAFLTLFPLYWALRTAFSTQRLLLAEPGNLLPVGFTVDSIRQALGLTSASDSVAAGGSGRTFDFWRYLLNTTIVSLAVAVCQVFFSAMAAYAFDNRAVYVVRKIPHLLGPGRQKRRAAAQAPAKVLAGISVEGEEVLTHRQGA